MMAICTVSHQLHDEINQLVIVSDIHGFFQPLETFEALYERMTERSQIVFNGDLFGGGAKLAQVARWVVQHAGDLATIGNHDEVMPQGSNGAPQPYNEAGAHQRLNDEQRRYFRARPHRLVLNWRGKRIVMMHGHIMPGGEPGSWRASPQEQVANFSDNDADLCVVSHTHYPFVHLHPGPIVANPGSIIAIILAVHDGEGLHLQSGKGELAPDEDPRNSFLVVTESAGNLHLKTTRFDYDRETALWEIEEAGQPRMARYRRWLMERIVDERI